MSTLHTPVLYDEVMRLLAPAPAKSYLDCTLGYGGHALGLLAAGASVTGLDQDQAMLNQATTRIQDSGYADRFTPIHSSFASYLASSRASYDGILFDLGVSSYQLDTPERGFSFRFDAPLDMRMNPAGQSVTAANLVNGLGKTELTELFRTLADSPAASRVATAIVAARKQTPFTTTTQLAELIARTVRGGSKRIHPATVFFQALRMAVNSEREELKAALPSALSCLAESGVLAVISFHSGEDKLVKDFFASSNLVSLTAKPITASESEINRNARARSAKLRAGRRIVA